MPRTPTGGGDRRDDDDEPDHRTSPSHVGTRRSRHRPLELWRVRGATDDLRGLAIETSFGYALGLELDPELVLLHLQPSLEVLVAYADRIEAALLAQGWQRLDPSSITQGARMTPTDPVRSALRHAAAVVAWRRVLLLALGAIVLVPASSYAQAAARPGRTPSRC